MSLIDRDETPECLSKVEGVDGTAMADGRSERMAREAVVMI